MPPFFRPPPPPFHSTGLAVDGFYLQPTGDIHADLSAGLASTSWRMPGPVVHARVRRVALLVKVGTNCPKLGGWVAPALLQHKNLLPSILYLQLNWCLCI